MESEYRQYVQSINELEGKLPLVKLTSVNESSETSSKLRDVYEKLLTKYPHLEGFWIRWAHTEFQIEDDVQGAITIYERSLRTHNLSYSLTIWVSYLKFLSYICYPTRDKPEVLHEKLNQASELIGDHFLSHEFWDLYLEVCSKPLSILLFILDSLTVHQYAKYYGRLVKIVNSSQHISDIKDLIPPELQGAEINEYELPQMREVVMSRLKLKYELHSRRVKHAFQYEKRIKRTFYYPLKAPDVLCWVDYIYNTDNKLSIYRRALIPCSHDAELWLSYIRYHHSKKVSASEIEAAYSVPVALKLVPVMLHYALWLELNEDFERAQNTYITAQSVAPAPAAAVTAITGVAMIEQSIDVSIQYSQFLYRRGDMEGARRVITNTINTAPANQRLRKQLLSLEEHELNKSPDKPKLQSVIDIISRYA